MISWDRILVAFIILVVCTSITAYVGWRFGRSQGRDDATKQMYEDLQYIRRQPVDELPEDRADVIKVTRGPSENFERQRRQQGRRARTSEAHFSQPRAQWTKPDPEDNFR